MKSKVLFHNLVGIVSFIALAWGPIAAAQDLWMQDDAADTGAEPNNSSPILYLSDDIWVRRVADPSYDPQPFPCASPTWTPLPHEGPCYRDPKTSSPNYLYVRVRNRGTTTSSGTETLHVYWAKASTGLSWPTDWNDHLASPCPGPPRLYGYEVTKPRRNAEAVAISDPTALTDYVNAVQMIDTSSFQFPDLSTYFDKQNTVHNTLFFTGIHNSLRFLPWHREFIGRYEALLREVSPALTLLYWDWTTNPSPTIIGPGGFMGASNGTVGAPFASFGLNRSKSAGTPASYDANLSAAYQSGTLLPSTSYSSFWTNLEVPTHNQAHNYVGGILASLSAAADPLFFMLHTNCDRMWALWQRQNVSRWAPATAYDASQANTAITSSMRPWNGTDAISPWINTIPGDPDGYVIQKPPTHHSIVYPPIYDDALLTIPPIAANQCVIIEIPFYPPPLAECGSFSDPQHLCLLARIEPITSAPPEGTGLWQNVKNHNNIVWRNVTVSDCNIGPFFLVAPGRIGAAGELIRNLRETRARLTLRFQEANVAFRSLFQFGIVRLRLEENLLEAWKRGGQQGQGIEFDGENILIFETGATIEGLEMEGREFGHMDLALELQRGYPHPEGNVFHLDVLQYDDQGLDGAGEPVGGQRYILDFNVLEILPKGSEWQYLDGGEEAPNNWAQREFTPPWRTGVAPFGYARGDVATGLRGREGRPVTCYFRRVFEVPDPTFYRSLSLNLITDDGIVVYLNGEEIYRANLPKGDIGPDTPARVAVTGAAARACRSVNISQWIGALKQGHNVLAAEVHPAPQEIPVALTLPDASISFDLELGANVPELPRQPPVVVITTPPDGALLPAGKTIQIRADVVDTDQDLSDVRIFLNGKVVGRGVEPLFDAFVIVDSPPPGRHRVSVEALDENRHVVRTESVFTIVQNVPPATEITLEHGAEFAAGEPISLTAVATDVDGEVEKVTFFAANLSRSHYPAAEMIVEVGSVESPPYELQVQGLAPGPYYVFTRVTDDDGAIGYSTHLPHIHIHIRSGEVTSFRRGDATAEGAVDITDAIVTLQVLILGQGQLTCDDAADADDSGIVDITDAIVTLSEIILGVQGIRLPGPLNCGVDPTDDDALGCETYSGECP
jgi:hypothetical protein